MANDPKDINFDEALDTLKSMFPDIDREEIASMILEIRNFNDIVDRLVILNESRERSKVKTIDFNEDQLAAEKRLLEQRQPQANQTGAPVEDKPTVMTTKPFDPFAFDEDYADNDEEITKEDKETKNDKSLLQDCVRELKQYNTQRTMHTLERLRHEKKLLLEYWESDRDEKVKELNKMKFKRETTDGEEIFRFIYNS